MLKNIKKVLKILAVTLSIFILIIAYKLIAIPILEYPFYFTGLCHSSVDTNTENKKVFLLKDENGKTLSCKRIRIEEEVFCSESPCPDYRVIKRLTTSKEWTISVSQDTFDDIITSYADGPSSEEQHISKKWFLFHIESNYNARITHEEIMNKENNEKIELSLKKELDEECTENSRFKDNYCDYY